MEWRRESHTDWNAWIRAGLLLALTAFLGRLIWTGEIKWYVNPKFTTFTASAGVGLVLMAAGQISRALKRRPGDAPVRMRLYLAVAAVVGLGFGLRPVVFASDLAAKQGLNITKRAAANTEVAVVAPPVEPTAQAPAPTPSAGDQAATAGSAPAAAPVGAGQTETGTSQKAAPTAPAASAAPAPTAPAGQAPAAAVITITPDNFVDWMTKFYGPNPGQYAGRRVRYEGFIFYPPDTKPEEFAVTRLVVTCHVAHAYPDGLLTVWPGQGRPEQDAWMRVEGVLEPVVHQGVSTLRIKADQLVTAPKPSDPYVYP